MRNKRSSLSGLLIFISVLLMAFHSAFGAEKPNILVIWGDDVGQSNISA
jgi:hypothetical protein